MELEWVNSDADVVAVADHLRTRGGAFSSHKEVRLERVAATARVADGANQAGSGELRQILAGGVVGDAGTALIVGPGQRGALGEDAQKVRLAVGKTTRKVELHAASVGWHRTKRVGAVRRRRGCHF